MKICFLVVIYNKSLKESTTIESILNIRDENFHCYVVNNGPNKIDFTELLSHKNIDFKCMEYLENKSLSKIYNEFIEYYEDSDRFVILDDDSILNKSFIKRVFTDNLQEFDLELPRILDTKKRVYYPLKNWYPIDEEDVLLNYEKDIIFSIGSGLVFTKNLVDKFKNRRKLLFNESFVFYGVDFSFFWNLIKYDLGAIKITSKSEIVHNMSLHGETSEFKIAELYINFALQMHHYPSIVNAKNLLYSLGKTIKQKKISLTLNMLRYYFIGNHPRS